MGVLLFVLPFDDALSWALVASLLVLLVLVVYWSRALQKTREAREALRMELEERLATLEYAVQNLDPGAIERRDKDFVDLLGSLLDYTESLQPIAAGTQDEN